MSSTDNFKYTSLPTIYFSSPTCSHCGQDVTTDGEGAWCENCNVEWNALEEYATGAWVDSGDGQVACDAEIPEVHEYDYRGKHWTITYGPCILSEGHRSEHLWAENVATEVLEA